MISVQNLGKKYKLGLVHEDLLSNKLINTLLGRKPLPKTVVSEAVEKKEIWALRNVSFEVAEGEVLGVIGRNGSGKSTLLKILTRITDPTEGMIRLHGRVASLLEVGTGFSGELTGRENIYLNGAILGMSREEINRKFDEIVDFSEVETFIDTPVKRYSSGMYVRLAFAVAAHLDPDIMLIDEVLAVGDLAFQKRCLKKMENVAKAGRTVLFVSHNMGLIQQLCSRVLLLHEGGIIGNGSSKKVVQTYMSLGMEEDTRSEQVWHDINQAPGSDIARLHAVRVLDHSGQTQTQFDVCDPVFVEMQYWLLKEMLVQVEFYFYSENGNLLFISRDNLDSAWGGGLQPPGLYSSSCEVPANFLNTGKIYVEAFVTNRKDLFYHKSSIHISQKEIVAFQINDAFNPKGVRGDYPFEWAASATIRPRLHWKVKRLTAVEGEEKIEPRLKSWLEHPAETVRQ